MSFETDKRKLQIVKNRETENQLKADRQKTENTLIKNRVTILSPNHSVFKKRTVFESPWKPMTIASFFNGENVDADTQYIDWEVVFDRFDERLIPFLDVKILYRVSDGSINDGADLETHSHIWHFEIEDLPNETFVKKVILRASLYFSDGDVYLPYQAKLLVTYSNPQDIL